MKTTNGTATSTRRTTGIVGVCWSQLLLVVVCVSATMSRVVASSDFSPNTPPPPPPHLSYVYSEINSMEYKDNSNSNNNSEEENEEEENRGNTEWRYPTHDLHPHRQELLDRDESSSSFSTTEGGWFHVSGQAIMCHGGESYQQEQDHPVLYVDASILNSVDPDFSERDYAAEEDDNNDDDEEDDDDNDGHSSMLSNSAALYRRPRAMVGSGTVAASTSDQDSSYYTSSSSYGDATTAESTTSNTYDIKGRQIALQPLPSPEQAQRKPWCRTLRITKAFSPRGRI